MEKWGRNNLLWGILKQGGRTQQLGAEGDQEEALGGLEGSCSGQRLRCTNLGQQRSSSVRALREARG